MNIACLVVLSFVTSAFADSCMPDEDCWPTQAQIQGLDGKLNGKLLQPVDYKDEDDFSKESAEYVKDTKGTIMTTRYLTKPGIIVEVLSDTDVRECVLFARKYNITISIVTSGHDFIGRNTAKGSFQINLHNLRSVVVNINETQYGSNGTVDVGVGNNWSKLYHELSENHDRVIVGGSSPLVSMGGYTLGGGHSPITRMLGLGVDNVIEIHLVTADGAIGVVNKDGWNFTETDGSVNASSDPDLFWALKGGGGGTFGIVTKLKFKIHKPPSAFQRLNCGWIFNDWTGQSNKPAKAFFNFFGGFRKTLPREWGGYVMFAPMFKGIAALGFVSVSLIHWGDYAHAVETSRELRQWHNEWFYSPCKFENHTTLWDLQKTVNDTSYARNYIYSGNVQPSTWSTSFTDDLVDSLSYAADKDKIFLAGTGTLVGGKATDFPDTSTSVVSGFRSADMALSIGTASPIPGLDDYIISKTRDAARKFYKHVDSGYVNEPDYYKEDWKTYYWGDKYDKLLSIKHKWDPENVFTCHHCVG